jgi:CHAT domain-containing protein
MTRVVAALVLGIAAAGGLCAVAGDDPPTRKLTPAERIRLEARWMNLTENAKEQYGAGRLADAVKSFEDALALARQLYPASEFKNGHHNLAASLNNLGKVHRDCGELAAAEPLYRGALEMFRKLYDGDDPVVAKSLHNLSDLLSDRGEYAEADRLSSDSLAMFKRLYRGDHPNIAAALHNRAILLESQGKYGEAEPLFKDALGIARRLFRGDHPAVGQGLTNLGLVLESQGKFSDAEPLLRGALEMDRRLHRGDHPSVTHGLTNLANLLRVRGKLEEAEPLSREALGMEKRLHRGDHPDVSADLRNLAMLLRDRGKLEEAESLAREALDMDKGLQPGGDRSDRAHGLRTLALVLRARGKHAEAEPLFREAIRLDRSFIEGLAGRAAEGEALTLVASVALARNYYFSSASALKADPAAIYAEVWSSKGLISQVVERRHLAARAAAADPKAAAVLAELTEVRRRRAELILAPLVADAATRKKRGDDLKRMADRIAALDRDLRGFLPDVSRIDRLRSATPTDLQKALPADAALVDFLRSTTFDHDPKNPEAEVKPSDSYLAFVVTRDKVAWVDLGPAKPIEDAVAAWREAIRLGKDIPPELPAKVRELAWAKVRKEMPDGVKVVYVSPDLALCRVPWAALPGDKPGTVLLEDYAVAVVPHAAFLLDKLWPQDAPAKPPTEALVVGGVAYDAEPASPAQVALNRGDPLLKPGQKAAWPALAATAAEAKGVAGLAAKKKLDPRTLGGDKGSAAAVLAALPKARYAHLATHGFFADSSFRSAFQIDPEAFRMTERGERVGAGALSPLVMTGLVLAGANKPNAPGRGILTGEALVDVDLSGLELAVLSACETGLGDLAGGEGTFGLQRAFHLASTRNVVASLWKVPDRPTAALMALFYRNLWEKDLPPVEALRQAQLEVYRHPDKVAELAAGFRGKFVEVAGSEEPAVKAGSDGKAHPRLWAAFSLSGPGR